MSASLAHESIGYLTLTAPYDGIILEKSITPGSVVGAGISVMKISSQDKNLLKVAIDNDIYGMKVGNIVTLKSIFPEETLTGMVSLVQAEKDPLHNKNALEITIR